MNNLSNFFKFLNSHSNYTRDPNLVLRDVSEGLISRERAKSVYGVEVSVDLNINEVETENLRRKSKQKEKKNET